MLGSVEDTKISKRFIKNQRFFKHIFELVGRCLCFHTSYMPLFKTRFLLQKKEARSIWRHQNVEINHRKYLFENMFDLVGRCLCFHTSGFSKIYFFYIFKVPRNIKNPQFKLSNSWCPVMSNTLEMLDYQNVEICKIICFKDVSISLLFVEALLHNKEVKKGSIFCESFGSSRYH